MPRNFTSRVRARSAGSPGPPRGRSWRSSRTRPSVEPDRGRGRRTAARVVDRRDRARSSTRPATARTRGVAGGLVGELGEPGRAAHEDRREQIGQAELRRVAVGGPVLGGQRLPETRAPGPAAVRQADLRRSARHDRRTARAGARRSPCTGARSSPRDTACRSGSGSPRSVPRLSSCALADARRRGLRRRPRRSRARPSRTAPGPVKPARASRVATTPACAPQPGCRRLVHEPSPQVLDDAAGLAAADAEGVHQRVLAESARSCRRRPPRRSSRSGSWDGSGARGSGRATTRPTRHITSTAAITRLEHRARRTRHAPRAQASAVGHRDAAGVHDGVLARVVEVEAVGERAVGEHGVGGGTLRRASHERARPAASAAAASSAARPKSIVEEPECSSPSVSRARSCACATTGAGTSSRRKVRARTARGGAPRTASSSAPDLRARTFSISSWMRPLVADGSWAGRHRASGRRARRHAAAGLGHHQAAGGDDPTGPCGAPGSRRSGRRRAMRDRGPPEPMRRTPCASTLKAAYSVRLLSSVSRMLCGNPVASTISFERRRGGHGQPAVVHDAPRRARPRRLVLVGISRSRPDSILPAVSERDRHARRWECRARSSWCRRGGRRSSGAPSDRRAAHLLREDRVVRGSARGACRGPAPRRARPSR